MSGGDAMDEQWLGRAEQALTRIVAHIQQMPHKDSSRLVSAIIAKGAGAAGATGILGLIGTFGSASTGTAIASLSGAAASNATLFWLGSLVGGGVFAGSVMTGGIGLAIGYYTLRKWNGQRRLEEQLSDEEKAIVLTCLVLAKAFHEQRASCHPVAKTDARFVLDQAWVPLVERLRQYKDQQAAKALNFKNGVQIRLRQQELDQLTRELAAWCA